MNCKRNNMKKIIFSLIIPIAFCACSKKSSDPDPSSSTSVNLASKISNVLPKPGTSSASASSVRLSYASWIDNTSYASEPWMGYQLFKALADHEVYDADGSKWGVENVRENVSLTGLLTKEAQTAADGTNTLVYGSSNINYTASATQTINATLPFADPSYAKTYFTDDPGASFQSGRTITITGSSFSTKNIISPFGGGGAFAIDIAWSAGNPFYIKSAMYNSNETSFLEGEYNSSSGVVRLNRGCKTSGGMNARVWVSGNDQTKAVSFKYESFSQSKLISLAGKGSTASGGVVIIKMLHNNSAATTTGATTRYFCMDADVTEDEFTAFYTDNFVSGGGSQTHSNYTGAGIQMVASTSSFTGTCSGNSYISEVDAMTLWTESDIPSTSNLWDETAGSLF